MTRLSDLAALLDLPWSGESDPEIVGVTTLQNAVDGRIAFLANSKYRRFLADTCASAVILQPGDAAGCPVPCLIADNPYWAFARISQHFNPSVPIAPVVSPDAFVAPDVSLGDGVGIEAGVSVGSGAVIGDGVQLLAGTVLGPGVRVGKDSVLGPNVSIVARANIGARVRIHPGVVIGADGFGFANKDGVWEKVPQLGSVRIGDDVEIGANTTIDCGALGDTVIEDGVKLDNLIQIGHNTRLGKHTIVAAHTAIAGSTNIGNFCTIAGSVAIAGHLSIAEGTTITGGSVITHDIHDPGVYSSGAQMAPNREWRRNAVRFNQLDQMARRIQALERKLANDPDKGGK